VVAGLAFAASVRQQGIECRGITDGVPGALS
jgi:hypothetical protein